MRHHYLYDFINKFESKLVISFEYEFVYKPFDVDAKKSFSGMLNKVHAHVCM